MSVLPWKSYAKLSFSRGLSGECRWPDGNDLYTKLWANLQFTTQTERLAARSEDRVILFGLYGQRTVMVHNTLQELKSCSIKRSPTVSCQTLQLQLSACIKGFFCCCCLLLFFLLLLLMAMYYIHCKTTVMAKRILKGIVSVHRFFPCCFEIVVFVFWFHLVGL